MIDVKVIRDNPNFVKNNTLIRGYDVSVVDKAGDLDDRWRAIKAENDSLRSERNKISQLINITKKEGKNVDDLLKEAKQIAKKIEDNEKHEKELKVELDKVLSLIPNIQKEDVPVGDEEKNKVVKRWGKIPKFGFKEKNHSELLENLGLLDMSRAAKLAGAGFYLMKGKLAKLERALINFMLDYHVKDGFIEINPPQLVNEKTMFGTGQLPKFEPDLYKTREGLYPIPTAEVPVTNIYADEVLSENELPKKFVSFTQCYRTEAGQHGAETPGIFRLHEFEKVEMVYICRPENSWDILEEMVKRSEKLLEMINLPYRRVLLATADSSFASAKTYDLEVWSPAMNKYLECSSCSNCTDFQARRMNTKYLENATNERKFVHTLNGSGLATPRLLISLIENNQTKEGTIKIPHVLWKYTGFKEIKSEKPIKRKEREECLHGKSKRKEVRKTKKSKKTVKKRRR